MASQRTKKLICLWKGCDDVFEEEAAYKAHIDKHFHEQMQTDLGNQLEDEPLPKKAKFNEDKMANEVDIGSR
jgi:hypothetical protein